MILATPDDYRNRNSIIDIKILPKEDGRYKWRYPRRDN